jgi:methyl-accepting chemotaxis protein
MDEVTQQNSALVEENAAAAKALEAQSQGMSERVSFFRVGNAQSAGVAPRTAMASSKRVGAQAAPPRPVTPPQLRSVSTVARRASEAVAQKQPAVTATRGPVGRMQAKLASAFPGDPDWKEF